MIVYSFSKLVIENNLKQFTIEIELKENFNISFVRSNYVALFGQQ